MTDHPRQQLQHIILHYGRSICDDPKRCEALLRDLCPDNRREVHLLVMALREGVARELLVTGQGALPMEAVMLRLSQRLQDHLGTAEHLAFWSVETWAWALGVKVSVPKDLPRQIPEDRFRVSAPAPRKSAALHAAEKQFAGWQKMGTAGELLAANASQWSAVRDEKSGLMWAVNSARTVNFPNPRKPMDWESAHQWVNMVNERGWCGFQDWRLPTKEELELLLVSEKQQELHIRCDLFPDISAMQYRVWSASPVVGYGHGQDAWLVHFRNGCSNMGGKTNSLYVRMVRSGQ